MIGLLALSAILSGALGSFVPELCQPFDECVVFAPKEGFKVKELRPASWNKCWLPQYHHHGRHHKECDYDSSDSSCKEKHGYELCTVYFTPKPKACGPFKTIQEILDELTLSLNEKNFALFASLHDLLHYEGSIFDGPVSMPIKGVCGAVEWFTDFIKLGNHSFGYVTNNVRILQNTNVAQVEWIFTYSDNNGNPQQLAITSVFTRDACNNWTIVLDAIPFSL